VAERVCVEVRPGYREALLQLVASSDEELLASSTSPAHEDAFFSSGEMLFCQDGAGVRGGGGGNLISRIWIQQTCL